MSNSVYSEAQATLISILISAPNQSGLLQAELAEAVGKDQSYISNIERGQRRVDVIEFYDLACAMKVDPIELFASLVRQLPNNSR